MKNFLPKINFFAAGVALALAVPVFAATTISSNINTGGTLTVTGESYLMGDVGIGTTTPDASLDIDGTYPLVLRPQQTDKRGGVGAWIYYADDATDFGEIALYDDVALFRMWGVGATSVNYPDIPNTFYIYQYRDQAYEAVSEFAFVINDAGNVGIGTSTPTVPFQVATPSSNATTSIEVGKASQNKGSCLVMYDMTGAVQYVTIQGGAFVVSAASCK